ncbi:MAG: hypothetical protein KKA07_01630 [Bacteroidetes bacterium]|nr:hypothetical protein [Bacteroidota bacterium]MBU1717750.1 hypothetical protein [Bacteroidota bacterium]
MENQRPSINLSKQRDFGEIFNATFDILRTDYRFILRVLLMYAGPFLLISAILGAYYQQNSFQMFQFKNGGVDLNMFTWVYLATILAGLVSNVMLVGTIASYMKLYKENGAGNFAPEDVWKTVSKSFFPLFGTVVLMILMMVVPVFILLVLGALLGAVGVLFMMLVVMVFLAYLGPSVSLAFVAQVCERLNPGEAIGRSFKITHTAWWWNFLLIIVFFLIAYLAGLIIQIPQVVMTMSSMMHGFDGGDPSNSGMVFIIVSTVCTFLSSIVMSIPYFGLSIHYFSLVEKKESPSLHNKINDIR